MTYDDLIAQLADKNPEALLLEPRDVYDPCVIGITNEPDDNWTRAQQVYVAVYDSDRCIEAIMGWAECDYTAAIEWFSYNTSGAWAGNGTPTFHYAGWGE